MTVHRTRLLALPLAVVAAVAVAGCSSPSPAETTPVSTAVPSSPVASPQASASAPTLPDATCENIIGEASFVELENAGWEYAEEPFTIVDSEIADGIQCTWTNPAEQGGNILTFGWAPLTAAESAEGQDALEAQGWIREEGAGDTVYITEDPAFALTVDAEGYGMTYLFGDGFVQVADVKSGLPIIERR